MKFLEIAHIYR